MVNLPPGMRMNFMPKELVTSFGGPATPPFPPFVRGGKGGCVGPSDFRVISGSDISKSNKTSTEPPIPQAKRGRCLAQESRPPRREPERTADGMEIIAVFRSVTP